MAERFEAEPDLRGKSLLIFDDGLRSLGGHWYEYDRATAELHRERRASVTLSGDRDFAGQRAFHAAGVEGLLIAAEHRRVAGFVPAAVASPRTLLELR